MFHSARRRALSCLAAAAAGTLLLTGCGGADEPAAATEDATQIEVEHAQGTTTVPVNPKTVITFDLATLDTLDTLGVEVAGLPKANVPDFLSQYEGEEYVDAGTLFEPDYEAVNAAEPDLIIVAGRSAAVYEDLAKIAPTIDLTIDQSDWLAGFKDATETLGEVFDREDEVATALADIDESIAAVKADSADKGEALIVLTSGGEVTAYGPGSRFGMLHDVLGVTPAVEDVEAASHGEAVSFEFIAEADPDLLFVIDRDAATGSGGAAAEQVLDNELVAQTTAWQQDAVTYLDPVRWYIVTAGLSTVPVMIDQVADALA